MFRIKLFNSIAEVGTSLLEKSVFETSANVANPQGVVLRSFKMQESDLNPELLGIARAGAGTNNIPVPLCSDKGIVVFNTPGANANAVKELVICSLYLSSRKIVQSINKVIELKNDTEIAKTAEKIKSDYVGPEIGGKTLGLLGLGAIGSKVANDAMALGMKVIGYDPFLSVRAAINLNPSVKLANTMDEVIAQSDYLSLHLPLTDKTKGVVNSEMIAKMKDGVRIMNFSRGEIVNNNDMKAAVSSGKVACHVTDFASPEIIDVPNIIVMPHLGASTPEAEDNCAEMACDQIRDFLINGNIKNSVNFPDVFLDRASKTRLTIINKNVQGIVEKISHVLASNHINIAEMINKSQGDFAYNIIDTDQDISDIIVEAMQKIDGVLRVRKI